MSGKLLGLDKTKIYHTIQLNKLRGFSVIGQLKLVSIVNYSSFAISNNAARKKEPFCSVKQRQ